MAVYHITARVATNPDAPGMILSGTTVAVNSQGTFRFHKKIAAPPAPPSYALTVTSPLNNSQILGSTQFIGVAPGHLNVELYNAADTFLNRTAPDAAGNFNITYDTTGLNNGIQNFTLRAWDAPAGDPNFAHSAIVVLSLNVDNPLPTNSPLNAGHLTAAIALPTSASGIWITSKGAILDGTTNNIVAIRDAFSAAALTTHKTVIVPAGDCGYTGVISVSGSFVLMGEGPTSILRGLDHTNRTIRMMGNSPVVKNLQLVTNGIPGRTAPWEHTGIHIQGASNFEIDNIYLNPVAAAGIQTSHSAGPGTIKRTTVSGTKADSIHMTDEAHSITVELCRIMNSGDDGIANVSYVGDGGNCKFATIRYNWISDNVSGRGISIVGGNDITVHNNYIQRGPYAGIFFARELGYNTFGVVRCTASFNTVESCGGVGSGHSNIFVLNDGTYTSSAITVTRNEIIGGYRGIRGYGPQLDVLYDSNKITNVTTPYFNTETVGSTTILYTSGNVGYQYTSAGGAEAPTTPPGPIPSITTNRHPIDWLQVGNAATGTYFVEDNRWGAGAIAEAPQTTGASDGFPARVMATYYEAYNSFSSSYPRIHNVDTRYNVIYLFNARFNGDGSIFFPWISATEIRAQDVQTCRNRGQKVVLTVGGAGHAFNFQTRAQSDAFIASFKTLATNLGGVDGCDLNNFEQLAINAAFITEMRYIAGELRNFYGTTFGITMPTAGTRVGGAPINGFAMDPGTDLSLAGALADVNLLTYVAPQYYDNSFYKLNNSIRELNQRWANRVGASRTMVGLGAGNYNTSNATTMTESNREWDKCIVDYPSLRGVFSWNADFDENQGYAFAANFKPKLDALTNPPIQEGVPPGQFIQKVERSLAVGPLGEVGYRMQWNWPTSVGGVLVDGNPSFSEVKGFPCAVYGAKPGYRSTTRYPASERAVRLPDGVSVNAAPSDAPSIIANNWVTAGGAVSTLAPSGATPGSNFPKQLPLTASATVVTGIFSLSATGKAHLAVDIWLQAPANPTQTAGFMNSPLTHEIMIPLRNVGDYGRHGFRTSTQGTLDHSVSIDGVTYHVYTFSDLFRSDTTGLTTAEAQSGLRYNFGSLNPNYTNEETGEGRRGWKFIVFQHDGTAHPLLADGTFRLDISKFINHLATRTDSRGTQFVQGTEHIVSIETGVEMVIGEGDVTVWNYRVRA